MTTQQRPPKKSKKPGPSLFGGDFNHGGFQSNGESDISFRGKQEIMLEETAPLIYTVSIFLHPSSMDKLKRFQVTFVTFRIC